MCHKRAHFLSSRLAKPMSYIIKTRKVSLMHLLLLLLLTSANAFNWPKTATNILFDGELAEVEEEYKCEKPGHKNFFWGGSRLSNGVWFLPLNNMYNQSNAKATCEKYDSHLIYFKNQVEYEVLIRQRETRKVPLWTGLELMAYNSDPDVGDLVRWDDGSAFHADAAFFTSQIAADNDEDEQTECIYMKKDTGLFVDHTDGCWVGLRGVCQHDCPPEDPEECVIAPQVIDANDWHAPPESDSSEESVAAADVSMSPWMWQDERADKLFRDECETADDEGDSWFGPQGATGADAAAVVVDLGCAAQLSGVVIKNANNNPWRDRSTTQFSLFVSDSSNSFNNGNRVLSGETLTNARDLECYEIPLEKFSFKAKGRYVKFQIDSYSGAGGGLQYIEFLMEKEYCPPARMDFEVLEETTINGIFPVSNALLLQPVCDSKDSESRGSLWHSKDIAEGEPYFIIDTKCVHNYSKVTLRNGVNYLGDNCAVGAFQLLASLNLETWTAVAGGYLPDMRGRSCDKQYDSAFKFKPTTARYFKFRAVTTRDNLPFACLQYFDVE